jgi:DNA repair protein RadA/Sms
MVLGSSILVSGPPGIGKSTLILQWLKYLSEKHNVPTLAITGEETRKMVLARARRVEAQDPRVFVARASSATEIDNALLSVNPFLLALDSLQAFTLGEEDTRGDLATSKEIARIYNAWAKENGKLVIFLCQVTKDGASAGPRAIEHLVDAHFMFEEIDETHSRLVSIKNRFGERKTLSWHMTERGLLPWKEEVGS